MSRRQRPQTNGNTPLHKGGRDQTFNQMLIQAGIREDWRTHYSTELHYQKPYRGAVCVYCRVMQRWRDLDRTQVQPWPQPRKHRLDRNDNVLKLEKLHCGKAKEGPHCRNVTQCRRNRKRLKPEPDVEIYPAEYLAREDD